MPGAHELLQGTHAKGYKLVLLAKAVPSRDQLLDSLGLRSYFAEVLLVNEKSDILFENIALRHGASKAHSYVIGDRAQGEIKFGHQGGWQTIWIKAGKFANELPDPGQNPDHIIYLLEDVLGIIL